MHSCEVFVVIISKHIIVSALCLKGFGRYISNLKTCCSSSFKLLATKKNNPPNATIALEDVTRRGYINAVCFCHSIVTLRDIQFTSMHTTQYTVYGAGDENGTVTHIEQNVSLRLGTRF